jgi:hypothetical protein
MHHPLLLSAFNLLSGQSGFAITPQRNKRKLTAPNTPAQKELSCAFTVLNAFMVQLQQ